MCRGVCEVKAHRDNLNLANETIMLSRFDLALLITCVGGGRFRNPPYYEYSVCSIYRRSILLQCTRGGCHVRVTTNLL